MREGTIRTQMLTMGSLYIIPSYQKFSPTAQIPLPLCTHTIHAGPTDKIFSIQPDMATQDDLYNSTELAKEIVVEIEKTFPPEESSEIEGVVSALQDLLERHLKVYKVKYRQTITSYKDVLEESEEAKASLNREIEALKDGEKERTKKAVENAVKVYKERRDEITRAADKERGEMEKERIRLVEQHREDKIEIEKSKKEARQMKEEKDETFKLLRGKEEAAEQLESKVKGLEDTLEIVRKEAAGWKAETVQVTRLQERAKKQRDTSREEVQLFRDMNQEQQQKIYDLETKLERAMQWTKRQRDHIVVLNDNLDDAVEDLRKYKPESAGLIKGWLTPLWKTAHDELHSSSDSDTDTTESLNTIAVSFKESGHNEKQIEALQTGVANQRNRIQELEQQLEAARDKIAKPQELRREQQAKMEELESGLETADTAAQDGESDPDREEKEIDKLTQEIIEDLEKQVQAFENELINLKQDYYLALDAIMSLREAPLPGPVLEKYEKELASAQDKLQKAEEALEESKNKVTETERDREEQIKALQQELDQKLGDYDTERGRLEDEVKRLEHELKRLEDEVRGLEGERQVLYDAVNEQANVIDRNEQQAQQTRTALEEQIAVFDAAQRELGRSIEKMAHEAVSQGRSAAETSRELKIAHRDIGRNQELIQTLILQRDQQEDVIRGSVEVQQRARQRARANPNPNPAEPGASPGVRPGDETGAAQDTGNFFRRTYDLLLATLQYNLVGGAIAAVFGIMLVVIIAEGRQFAEWKHANVETRALWVAVSQQPTICLRPPNFDYFWYTIRELFSGQRAYR